MPKSNFSKPVVCVALVALALLPSGCIVTRDSPAPGCVESIGFPVSGGCFGKTAILDLAVEPEIECLDVEANNCNGGVLEVRNDCDETLVIGGVEVPPAESVGLDLVEEDGGYGLVEVSSNFSDHVPKADRKVELAGTLGAQEVRLTFTKTAKLCQ